jgi:homoserine O-acetyltransferase
MLMTRGVCTELEVPLPAELRHLGNAVMATSSGNRGGPLVVVLGGISSNRFVCYDKDGGAGWWPGLVGSGCAIDPELHHIVGIDFAADSTGKISPTTSDQALVICETLTVLGAEVADAVVGASYGGMVTLALAQNYPERVGKLVVISAGAEPHPAATAMRELQRRVVSLGLRNGDAEAALSIARGMAMLSYRTNEEFAKRFAGGLPDERPLGTSEPGKYLRARGNAFLSVMSPERYLSLSGSIDRHRVDPARIANDVLLIGAETDQLVPPSQMLALGAGLAGSSEVHLLDCLHGHDMFLKEAEALGRLIKPFLDPRR